jgi:hypothetical protein
MASANHRVTWALAAGTIAVLVAAAPGALRDARERGDIYLFCWASVEDNMARRHRAQQGVR